MKMTPLLFLGAALAASAAFTGCSIRHAAYNAMAPYPTGKETAEKTDTAEKNPLIAITGENDPELVAAFFPVALKTYEMLMFQDPTHAGVCLMTGELYVMYASAFVQGPAEQLPSESYAEQNDQYLRAQNFYDRGKRYVLMALDRRVAGFSAAVFSDDAKAREKVLAACGKKDVAALYWAGAGALGAFSLSPLDLRYLQTLPGAVAMMERAAELDPGFNNGAIWEILAAFYAAAPEPMGGGHDKAVDAWHKALDYSKGQNPSVYILYAKSFCVPTQDGAGFDEALEKALAIDPESRPDERLMLTIARRQALWLKDHKAEFILE